MHFDEVLDKINGFGRYQWFAIFISSLHWFLVAFNALCTVFIAATPPFLCNDNYVGNLSHSDWENVTSSEQCSVIGTNSTTSANETCGEWTYGQSVLGSTIVTEWNLVCGRQWFITISTSVYFAGQMAGLMPLGIVTDKIGRRKGILISVTAMTGFMYAVALSPNIYAFMVFRFFTAFFAMGLGTATYGFALEVVSIKHRLLAVYLNHLPWCFGICVLVGISYLSRNWQNTMYILAGISSLITVVTFIFLPESARWLYATNDSKRGDAIVRKIAKMNRTEDKLEQDLKIVVYGTQKANTLELLKTREMRKRTLVACFLWFVVSLSYYGLFFNAVNLPLSIYVDMIVGGVLEIVGNTLQWLMLTKFGRKKPGILVFVSAGICLLVTLAFRRGDVAISVLTIVGRMIMGIGFGVAYIFSAELAPTVLRTNSMSAGSVFARIGAIITPFILIANELHPAISSVTFGALSVFAGLLIFLLPETKGTRLPDTIDDVESAKLRGKPVKEIYIIAANDSTDGSKMSEKHVSTKN